MKLKLSLNFEDKQFVVRSKREREKMLEWLIGYLSLLKCDAGWHIHWINWLVLGCVWSESLVGNKAGFGSRKQLVKNFISSWAGETHTPMVYISWVYWILISSKIQLVTICFVFLPLCKGSPSLFISWVLFHLRVNTQHLNIAATIFLLLVCFLRQQIEVLFALVNSMHLILSFVIACAHIALPGAVFLELNTRSLYLGWSLWAASY